MMFHPALLIAIIILTSLIVGIGLGWLVFSMLSNSDAQKIQNELDGVHANFQSAREDAHQLRSQLQLAEDQKNRALMILKTTSGHQNFQKIRKQLEQARTQIQALNGEITQRDQIIFDLKDRIHVLTKHLSRQSHSSKQPETGKILKLPVPSMAKANDDLTKIAGITPQIARQLNSLGIISYRQLAECSAGQLKTMQRLIGQGKLLPVDQWVKTAHLLFLDQYAQPADPTSTRSQQTRNIG